MFIPLTSLTQLSSAGSSTLGSMRVGGRRFDCKVTRKSSSVKLLETAFTRTIGSVLPKFNSSSFLHIVDRASSLWTYQNTVLDELISKANIYFVKWNMFFFSNWKFLTRRHTYRHCLWMIFSNLHTSTILCRDKMYAFTFLLRATPSSQSNITQSTSSPSTFFNFFSSFPGIYKHALRAVYFRSLVSCRGVTYVALNCFTGGKCLRKSRLAEGTILELNIVLPISKKKRNILTYIILPWHLFL